MKSVYSELKPNITLTPDENTQYIFIVKDGSSYSADIELNLKKEGLSCELSVLGRIGKNAAVTIKTTANHLVAGTSCVTNYRVILEEEASSDYTGKIIIRKKASQTNSYLDNKTLVMGEKTKNTTRPILEIENDDVKASHGSTTGRVGEAEIFYLTSRGLARSEAENLIAEGFFENIVAKILDPDVREKVRADVKS